MKTAGQVPSAMLAVHAVPVAARVGVDSPEGLVFDSVNNRCLVSRRGTASVIATDSLGNSGYWQACLSHCLGNSISGKTFLLSTGMVLGDPTKDRIDLNYREVLALLDSRYHARNSSTFGPAGSASNEAALDHIGPVNGGVAEFRWYGQSDWGAVSHRGAYRLMCLSFGFEAVTSGNPRWTDPELIFPEILHFSDRVNPYFCCRVRAESDYSGGEPDLADPGYVVDHMYARGPPPPRLEVTDVDGDQAEINIADLVYLVKDPFSGGEAPPPCENSRALFAPRVIRHAATRVTSTNT